MSASFSLKNQPSPSGSALTLAGSSVERGVGVGHFAADRRIDFARRLDAFDHRRLAAGADLAAGFRQFDKHDVAQLLGGVFGDADGGFVAVDADPFMLIGETDFAHELLLISDGAAIAVRHEGHRRDARRQRLAAHHQIDLGAVAGECGFDIAHRDGRVQARAEAAAGDLADDAAGLVGDLGAFARRRPAVGTDADALLAPCR